MSDLILVDNNNPEPPPPRQAKNQFQVQAWMFDLVCNEGLTPDSAYQRMRREDNETTKLMGSGAAVQKALTELEANWKNAHGPAARAYMKLTNRELKLRGDVQMALLNIDTTEPRDLREIMRLVQLVAARETWQGQTQPADLLEAIELLETAKVDCSGFRAALDEMYPPATPDDDEADPQ